MVFIITPIKRDQCWYHSKTENIPVQVDNIFGCCDDPFENNLAAFVIVSIFIEGYIFIASIHMAYYEFYVVQHIIMCYHILNLIKYPIQHNKYQSTYFHWSFTL